MVRLVEVKETPERPEMVKAERRYRLGFGNGAWLEIEGNFEKEAVRELVEILREGSEC